LVRANGAGGAVNFTGVPCITVWIRDVLFTAAARSLVESGRVVKMKSWRQSVRDINRQDSNQERKNVMGKTEKFWLTMLFQFVIQGLGELIKQWTEDDDGKGK